MHKRLTVAWLVGMLVLGTIAFHSMAWATDTCGDLNEPCCSISGGPPINCNGALVCALSGTCISGGCGGVGEPCCAIVALGDVFGASTSDHAVGVGCDPGLVCATASGPNGTCDPQSPAPAASHSVMVAMAALLAGTGHYLTRKRTRA